MPVTINGTTGLITAGATSSGGSGVASNTALGGGALQGNTSGQYNVAIGNNALNAITTASSNTAVGYYAGYLNTTAGGQTFVGYQAGFNSTASNNTAIGSSAGTSITTGTGNTCIGSQAGQNMTTGVQNTFIGGAWNTNGAGYYVTTGSKNTIIGGYDGNQGGVDIRTLSNRIVISDGDGNPRIYNDGQTTTFSPNSSASVQIIPDAGGITGGTIGRVGWTVAGYSGQYISGDVISSAAYGMLGSDSGTSGWRIWTYSGGYAYRFQFNANGAAYNTTGTWGTISDIRIKQDIVPANSAWSDIKALAFKKYRFKSDVAFESSEENTTGFKAPTLFGLVAQEVQEISPGLVEETDSDEVEDGKLLAIKTSVLLMKATKALQEAMERIETLETKIQQLENK